MTNASQRPSAEHPIGDHPLPFVAEPVGDRECESLALTMARRLGSTTPVRYRQAMNTIYICDDAVIRIGRTTAPPETGLALAEVLYAAGITVARPLLDTAIVRDGLSATAWQRLRPSGAAVDWTRIGEMIATLHDLDPGRIPHGYPLSSPAVFGWWDIGTLLDQVTDRLDDRALQGLMQTVERTRHWRAHLEIAPVVCHGDLHPGNVMQTATGPAILDWDLLCRAPRGWDHAPLRHWGSVWAGDSSVRGAFAAGYGGEPDDDGFSESVADLRLAVATVMLAGANDHEAGPELQRRLRYWRREPDAPRWQAR